MWAVFAPIVRWPLYSPRRLAAVVVALIAVVMVMGNCSGGEPAAEPDPTPAATTTASAAPTVSSGSEPASSAEADVELTDEDATGSHDEVGGEVAAGFVTAWARPELSADTWMQGLRPIITDRLAGELDGADPATAPSLKVVAEPVAVDSEGTSVVFDVQTTDGVVRVHLVDVDGTWLTDRVELL